MTSYCAPLYKLEFTTDTQIEQSCMWLGEIKRQAKPYPLKAALLLNNNINGNVWFMANNVKISTGEKVTFTLQQIDLTWQINNHNINTLNQLLGTEIEGVLHKLSDLSS
jgi:hypothetical protein